VMGKGWHRTGRNSFFCANGKENHYWGTGVFYYTS